MSLYINQSNDSDKYERNMTPPSNVFFQLIFQIIVLNNYLQIIYLNVQKRLKSVLDTWLLHMYNSWISLMTHSLNELVMSFKWLF